VREDRVRIRNEARACAGVLARQGVLFAFCTQGIGPDKPWEKWRANLNQAVEAGLAPEAALRALTVDAARILGVAPQVGSLTVGKAAHLTVTDGDFHDPKTQIRHVFIDGRHFEYTGKTPGEKRDPKEEREEKKEPISKGKLSPAPGFASEIEADRKPTLRTGGSVLLRNATVLTVTKGTLAGADILVRDGKIQAVGKDLKAPVGVQEESMSSRSQLSPKCALLT
jgi:imidazolonepropionase-like amidohydrolase